MRDIIHDILASPVPVATFVSPSGARAASAGTYLLYASHIAAMAPATNLGAATPVNLQGFDGPGGGKRPGGASDKADKAPADAPAMEKKMVNDAVAYLRGLAELRGRNADWAERAVREAVSLPASEALKLRVIDLVADDLPQLLQKLDGRQVSAGGQDYRLTTATAELVPRAPDWRTRLLAVITNPALTYILLMVGIYGLLFEFMYPGSALPGVLGGISLLLALFALQMLPVSYAGLALVALGVGLFVAEFLTSGSGVLGAGGLIAFVTGSVMLIDTDMPMYSVPPALIGGIAVAGAAGLLMMVKFAARARRQPVVSGRELLLGARGNVITGGEAPYAMVEGERWRVRAPGPLQPGDRVRVLRVDGLTLDVDVVQAQLEAKE
jgi:membrane-bound serine protease (ClpP class)